MSDNSSSDIGAFLAGFVIGGLVGAAAALIMAPQSGEETRAQIVARGQELRHAGEERLGEYRAKTGEYVADARERIQDAGTQAQERARIVLDEGRTKMNEALESGKERVTQIRTDITDRVKKNGTTEEGDASEGS